MRDADPWHIPRTSNCHGYRAQWHATYPRRLDGDFPLDDSTECILRCAPKLWALLHSDHLPSTFLHKREPKTKKHTLVTHFLGGFLFWGGMAQITQVMDDHNFVLKQP